MARLSNEEYAHHQCLRWAAGKSLDGQGPLGYPSVTVEGRLAKGEPMVRSAQAGSKEPNMYGSMGHVGAAVMSLPDALRDVVEGYYLADGSLGQRIGRVCSRLDITRPVYQGMLKAALLLIYDKVRTYGEQREGQTGHHTQQETRSKSEGYQTS